MKISAQESNTWLQTMAEQLSALTRDTEPLILGIKTGGALVAEKLHAAMQLPERPGALNISFYRDDFSRIGLHPTVGPSDIPFDIDARTIILVDDVLFSGRTIRAAMNEIFDYGRPTRVLLAVLLDRHGRELPIHADVTGHRISLSDNQNIKLLSDLSFQVQTKTNG